MPDPIRLLLVEDNPADVFLMEAALEMSGVPVQLSVARDGQEALDWLEGAHGGPKFPDLTLLDLNMPRVNGFEFLSRVRADERFSHLPTIVFTTSNDPADVKRAYALQANSYVSKPASLDEFMLVIERLAAYWFGSASIPSSYRPG